ncbi:DUF1828 domain-containing protein [Pediococcus pentosaceus]|uniref:DUF1828 domain-containing protein n=1 Tax=Pediococcus pentosaceus TaxID=1255 RepID=UPI003D784272
MTPLDAKKLSDDYFKWYKNNSKFYNIKSDVVRIDLPFYDNFSDEISIYAIKNRDNTIKISDDGWTINNLEDMGVSISRSTKRKELFMKQIKIYGVQTDGIELFIDKLSYEEFPKAKHRVLQAILFVNDMFMTAKTNTSTLFLEDLNVFFENNGIRTTKNASFVGQSGLNHKFEYTIAGFKDIPTKLIKTMSYANNPMFAKSILTDVEQTRPILDDRSAFYVFLNDLDKNSKPTAINEDILNLFTQNEIKPVLYSKRNEVVKELAE